MKAPIHPPMVLSDTSLRSAEIAAKSPACDFSAVYRDHVASTIGWLRALGVPESEVEDVAQEVFLVVRRKLPDFVAGNLPGWLYRIAQRTASDYRRRAWFRRWFSRASEEELKREAHPGHNPAVAYEQRQAQIALTKLLAGLDDNMRIVFWMFEVEDRSAKEIAELLGVPPTTVFMRLHHARRLLKQRVELQQRRERAS